MLEYVLAAIAGFVVKSVDWLDDDKKSKHPIKYLLAVIYGLLLGYLIATASFSVIFLAAIVAQVFARKIDTTAHRIGIVASMLGILAIGFPSFDVLLFGYFLILAFLDEADFIGKLRPLTEYRVFLKIGAVVPVLMGRWDYFAGIIAFDVGYELFREIGFNINKKRRKQK